MNKYAAEKIAQEYYNLGVEEALGLTKHAFYGPLKLRNDYLTPLTALGAMFTGAGAGGYGAAKALSETPIFSKGLQALDESALYNALKTVGNKDAVANADALSDLAALGGGLSIAGAGALGAYAGGGLALKGAKKLLNRNKPIERYLDLGVAQVPLGKALI